MRLKERCSNPQTVLIVFLVIFIMVMITTVIILRANDQPGITVVGHAPLVGVVTVGPTVIPSRARATVVPRNVCESPECITLAHQLHNWHDPSIDPCDNFYKFACGKYNEHTIVKGTRSEKKETVMSRLIEEFLITMKDSESKSENAMKILYDKCKSLEDDEESEKDTEKSYTDIFHDIQKIGSFPMITPNWDPSEFDLNEMLENIGKLGRAQNGLFSLTALTDQSLGVVPIERDKPLKHLEKIIMTILEVNGVNFDEDLVRKDLKEYRKLNSLMMEKHPNDYGSFLELSELEDKNPSIDFRQFINSIINPGRKELEKKIEDRIFGLESSAFFDKKYKLEKLIKKWSPRTLANYLIIFYIDFSLSGLRSLKDQKCIKIVEQFLPNPALRVFVRNFFDKENLEIVSELVEEYRKVFVEMIRESVWLHDETRKNAIRKVEKMGKMIGYPEEFEEPGALDKTYETLNITPEESYYATINKLNKYKNEQLIEYVALETPLNPMESMMEVNAFYVIQSNFLAILAPFIDDPEFDATYPAYAKIAVTGNTVGHEIGHGYDPDGKDHDENGKKRNWWTPEDTVEYEKRIQCMIDQYDNYDDPDFGRNLIGNNTIAEMIADNIGVETSWRAFKKLDLSKEPKIIGFDNYSIPKLYFRISALDYCKPRDLVNSLEDMLEDSHPTDSFRVNGVYSNMKQFAEAFNCPVGSPMNPEMKCVLF